MSRDRSTPAQNYICSAFDCRHGHNGGPLRASFAAGVRTREQAVQQLRAAGWAIAPGEAVCPECNSSQLAAALRASLPFEAAKRAVRDAALWAGKEPPVAAE